MPPRITTIASATAIVLLAVLFMARTMSHMPLRGRRRVGMWPDALPPLWSHNWTYFADLERVYASTCAADVASALASADADPRGLSCVGGEDDPSRYCFAKEVCVSAEEGAFISVPSSVDLDALPPPPPLRMHAAYPGYCGEQKWALPMKHRPPIGVVQHGPVVLGDLCECSHYAHGIGTNTYGLFGQALRLSLALPEVAAKPGHGAGAGQEHLLRAVHLIATRMYGTQKPSTGRKLQGEPMEGMIEPIFVPSSPSEFYFVPTAVDPPPSQLHCFQNALIGLRHTCPQPPHVCTHTVSTQEHSLYQRYVVSMAQDLASGTSGSVKDVYGDATVADVNTHEAFSGNAPLLVIAQRETTRSIENIAEVIAMLQGFEARVGAAVCHALAELGDADLMRLRRELAAATPPPFSSAVLTAAFDLGAPDTMEDVRSMAALMQDAIDCKGSQPRWLQPLLHWRVVALENMTLWQQVRLFARTQIYVTARGNSNTNLVWMPIGSSMLDLCPLHWEDTYWDHIIPMTRMRHSDMRCITEKCFPRAEWHQAHDTPAWRSGKQRNLLVHVDTMFAVVLRELVALFSRQLQTSHLHQDLIDTWAPDCF